MPPSEAVTKKVTAQAKNAEARRRAKRQGRSKGHDELVEKASAELQHWSNDMAPSWGLSWGLSRGCLRRANAVLLLGG